MKSFFTLLLIVSAPFLSAQETKSVKPVEKSAAQLKAEKLYKERKYQEVIAILDKLIPATKPTTSAQAANKHTMMRTLAFAYFNKQQKDKSDELTQKRYDYITAEAARFPEDPYLVMLRLYDLSYIASKVNITRESKKRISLNLNAVEIAEELVKKNPDHEQAKICLFTAYTNLAKSYRWNKELREKAPAVVDKGLAVLEMMKTFPKHTSKAFMTLQIQVYKVSVLSLQKKYQKALEVSTDLLEKTKPMLSEKSNATQYQLSELFGSLYQHAYLYEKLGDGKEAQKQLQNLIDTIDTLIKKDPKNRIYLNAKSRYSTWKGKKLR